MLDKDLISKLNTGSFLAVKTKTGDVLGEELTRARGHRELMQTILEREQGSSYVLEQLADNVILFHDPSIPLRPSVYLSKAQREKIMSEAGKKAILDICPEMAPDYAAAEVINKTAGGCPTCRLAAACDRISDSLINKGCSTKDLDPLLPLTGPDFLRFLYMAEKGVIYESLTDSDLKKTMPLVSAQVQGQVIDPLELRIKDVLLTASTAKRMSILKACPACVYKHLGTAAAYFNESQIVEYRSHRVLAIGEMVLAEHEAQGLTDKLLAIDIRVERLAAMADRGYIPNILPLADRAEGALYDTSI